MLTFTKGKPICRIDGGRYNNKIVRVTDEPEQSEYEPDDPYDLITESEIRSTGKKINVRQMERMRRALMYGEDISDEDMKEPYKEVKKKYDSRITKEIIINDGMCVPVPNPSTRDVLYVSGASGSGKTTYIAMYLKEFKKMFPERKIFVFSRLHDDKVIDALKPIRVKIDDELITNPIDAKELKNSCVVFDDIDTISPPDLMDAIHHLRDDLLQTGRHFNIYMCCVSHMLQNYKASRIILSESTTVTFFPKSGSAYHITRFLKTYVGLPNDEIKKILALPSRWVTVNKNYPQYILYSSGVYLLSK